jgi:hypothetical protein
VVSPKVFFDSGKPTPSADGTTPPDRIVFLGGRSFLLNRSAKWLKDGGQYIEGAHRWLKGRKFEELPSGQSPVGVNGAGRLHKPDESTKIKMIRASAIVDYFNRLEPTEQDVLLAEYRRLPGNEDASLFHRGFREWAFDQKKERAA